MRNGLVNLKRNNNMKKKNIVEHIDGAYLGDDYLEKNEIKPEHHEKILKENDLSGEMFFAKGECWSVKDDFNLCCGPATTDEALADSIYTDEYLEEIVKELQIPEDKIWIGASENTHEINVESKKEANEIYKKLKKRIEKDFDICEWVE